MDFRKRGPSAFKPKIPAARSRAAARSPAVTSARAVDSPASDSTTSGLNESSHDTSAPKAPIPIELLIKGSNDVPDSNRDSGAPSTSTTRTAGDSESIIREAQPVAEPSSPVASTKPSPRSTRPTGSTETRIARRASSVASAPSSHQNEAAAEEQRDARVLETPTSTIPPSRQNAVASSSRASTTHKAPSETRVAAPNTSSAAPRETTGSSTDGAFTNDAASSAAQTEQPKGRKGKRGASSRDIEAVIRERTITPDDEANVNPPKKRGRKSKQASSGVKQPRSGKNKDVEAPQPEDESDHGEATANGDEKVVKKRKKRERARSVTPDDAEEQMVDHQTLKMSDLTRDLHIGRKFSRHDELRERERNRRRKKQADTAHEDINGTTTEGQAPVAASDVPAPNFHSADHGLETPATASGPQFQIIDGQIVVDQNSLVMDRHARVRAADGELEEIEENDFTRLTTSASYQNGSKLKGPNHWNEMETDKFYRALRMFGTDFEIISKMFPGKNRRHIKMKFNREEKHRPRRITAALVGEKSIAIDLEEFEVHTGEKLDSMESIKTELRKNEEEWTEKYESTRRAHEEDMSRKKAELFGEQQQAGDNGGGGGGDEADGADAHELDAATAAARANIVLEEGEELVEIIGDGPVAPEPQPVSGRRGRKMAARGKGARHGLVDMTL